MLSKLMKYEMPALGRKIVPLYVAWAATAVLLGLVIDRPTMKSEFFPVLIVALYVGLTAAVFVMALVMIIQRYNRDLLGDGGYFSHTLPVKAGTHIMNKTLSATIWVVLSGLVALVTILIIVFISDANEFLSVEWSRIFSNITGKEVLFLIEFFILACFSIVKSILAIYTALTIGHQAQNHTTLCSIGAYIGVLICEGTFGNLVTKIIPNINIEYTGGIFPNFGDVQISLLILALITLLIAAVYFFICKYLMEKRLNLA